MGFHPEKQLSGTIFRPCIIFVLFILFDCHCLCSPQHQIPLRDSYCSSSCLLIECHISSCAHQQHVGLSIWLLCILALAETPLSPICAGKVNPAAVYTVVQCTSHVRCRARSKVIRQIHRDFFCWHCFCSQIYFSTATGPDPFGAWVSEPKKSAKRTSNRWRGAHQNLKERPDTLSNDAIQA